MVSSFDTDDRRGIFNKANDWRKNLKQSIKQSTRSF